MPGMFGLTPDEILQQQRAQTDVAADRYAQQDPFQRAAATMYRGGAGLGNIGAGMLGLQNPQVAAAQKLQGLQQGVDTTSPEGLLVLAKRLSDAGMNDKAMLVVQAAQKMRENEADIKQKEAHAKFYETPKVGSVDPLQRLLVMRQERINAITANPNNEQAKYELKMIESKIQDAKKSVYSQKLNDLTDLYGPDAAKRIANGTAKIVHTPGGGVAIVDVGSAIGGKPTQGAIDSSAFEAAPVEDNQVTKPPILESGVAPPFDRSNMAQTISEINQMPEPDRSQAMAALKVQAQQPAPSVNPVKQLIAGQVSPEPMALTPNGMKVYSDLALAGKLPSGYGKWGINTRNEFLNSEGEKRYGASGTGESAAAEQGGAKANVAALTQITKDISAIKPYKVMLDTNIDIAKDLASKVLKTNSKLANQSITWIAQNLTDSPDIAELMAQMHFVTTESARVLSNPRLVGQLTDNSIKDMQMVINGNAPLGVIVRVLDRIKNDGLNRVNAMENQASLIKNQLANRDKNSGSEKPQTPSAKKWNPTSGKWE